MSLDVYLHGPRGSQPSGSGIFVRESGQTREITRDEWDAKFPGTKPVVFNADADDDTIYHRNVTHNLTKMADAAGIYEHLWRPDEIGIATAGQLVEPLMAGLGRLRAEPDKFKELNPPNGWGSYDGLVAFVTEYLDACARTPAATVSVSR